MKKTRIEWVRNPDGSAGYTWNPTTGCTKGCTYCYARRLAEGRLRGRAGYPADEPFRPTFHADRLEEPLRLRTASRIFVCSMGEIFDPTIPDDWRDQVFGTILASAGDNHGHTFMVLTKQPEMMRRYMTKPDTEANVWTYAMERGWTPSDEWANVAPPGSVLPKDPPWPPRNLWLGVTCENQQAANERIPLLLQTPAAVRFVSVEPMLGPVELFGSWHDWLAGWATEAEADRDGYPMPVLVQTPKLDWVICGAMTGPGAVAPDPDWVDNLIDQCTAAGVPILAKDNLHMAFPPREFPEVSAS